MCQQTTQLDPKLQHPAGLAYYEGLSGVFGNLVQALCIIEQATITVDKSVEMITRSSM